MRVLLPFACAALLGGCSSLIFPEAEPSAFYRLEPAGSVPAVMVQNHETPVAVLVSRPDAPRALGADTIAIQQSDATLAYASGVRWVEATPGLIQNAVIEELQNTDGAFLAARPRDGISADYELALEIHRFEADYCNGMESAPVADVSITARLVKTKGRDLLASRRFEAESRASTNRVGEIVQAFNAAMGQVNGELIAWTAEEISQASPNAAEASK